MRENDKMIIACKSSWKPMLQSYSFFFIIDGWSWSDHHLPSQSYPSEYCILKTYVRAYLLFEEHILYRGESYFSKLLIEDGLVVLPHFLIV
jgi:hypothetical protein